MRSIVKLLLANLRHKKGTFIGISILMALLTFSYACTISNNDNTTRALYDLFETEEPGDLTLNYFDPPTEKMEQVMRDNDSIKDWRVETILCSARTEIVNGNECQELMSLYRDRDGLQVFDESLKAFRSGDVTLKKGEVYLPYLAHLLTDFQIGNTICFPMNDGEDEVFTIRGYYHTTRYRNELIASREDFDRILAEGCGRFEELGHTFHAIRELHIYTQEGTDVLALKKALFKECEEFEATYYMQTLTGRLDNAMIYNSVGTKILYAFVIILIIIVMIVIANSISTAIETDYTNLGILKANGLSNRALQMVWVLQYSLALLAGTVTGLLIAIPITRVMGTLFMSLSGLLTDNVLSLGKCSLLALAIIVLCIGFVCISTAKLNKISPMQAISGGKGEVWFDSRLQLPIRKRGLHLSLAFRQFTSRWKRYFGSMVIAMLLAFFVCTILLLGSGINSDLFSVPSGDVELRLSTDFRPEDTEQIESACKELDADATISLWTGRQMLVEDESILVEVYSDPSCHHEPLRGRIPQYDNEVTMTETLADLMHKEIGDTITIKNNGKTAEYVITGMFQTLMGQICEITFDGGRRIGIDHPDIGYVQLSDKAMSDKMAKHLNQKLPEMLTAEPIDVDALMQETTDEIDFIMDVILYAIYFISLLFSAVVVTMVCSRTFLMERTDTGIFKAIGFSVPNLRTQFALRFTVVSVIGTIAGCGVSALLSRKLITQLLRMFGVSQFHAEPGIWFVLSPLLVFGVTFYLVAYFASRKVRSVSVRDLISE